MGDSVRVAVRVRPFNKREMDLKARLIIKMDGTTTTIINPENEQPKNFTFDFSYWSHDGFVEEADGFTVPDGPNSRYASQRTVFDDIGKDILDNAFGGYNCSLFAYGQTGSGKSYSMVGYGVNRGIVPIICEEMFKRVEANTNADVQYMVTVSMLEIYNECVRDLLTSKQPKQGGLKLRSKPGIGNYVDGLSVMPVGSYDAIFKAMEEGTKNRTVASTKMNNNSSRAHTVFTLHFTTITNVNGEKNETTSKVNLVDLAGSERADSTGATGDRLKEGSAINQSLSALGNVISALAEQAEGKKKVFVPYRNSVLTRLLQDALGGNSKTIMIAALSPADVNYDETLSTLRYADRAKQIKNAVTKNENPTDRIIRELKEENDRLVKLLESKGIGMNSGGGGGAAGGGGDSEEAARLQAQLEEQVRENQRIMEEMQKSWEQKLNEAMERSSQSSDDGGAMSAASAKASHLPHIINLHEDPMLSECVVYVFKEGATAIGRSDAPTKQDIVLSGLNIKKQHAVVSNEDGVVTIAPVEASTKLFLNGDLVTQPTALNHDDRLIIGNNFVFRFFDPSKDGRESKEQHEQKQMHGGAAAGGADDREAGSSSVTWAKAMEELAVKQGMRLQQDLEKNNRLEQEEAEKRKELEDRLRSMEEEMQRERTRAQEALELQRQQFEERAGSGRVTEEELQQLQEQEAAFQRRTEDLNQELQRRREMSARIIEEQLKRKRETKKVESDLVTLMPLINEANSMAEEMAKAVRFESRLVVKTPKTAVPDPTHDATAVASEHKKLEIFIRVTNVADSSVWTWAPAKFENRLFMMRELYQELQATGQLRQIPLAQDPFWDPPEAFEIGKAYVYLRALSQLVEIENSFAIVDHKGQEQGTLQVEVHPQTPEGEDMDYLQDSEQLIGRAISFQINVPQAKGLPAKYSNDVHVTFEFMGLSCQTPPFEGKMQDPTWNYETRFQCPQVTEATRQYLLKEAVVFEVKGFTDAQSKAAFAALAAPTVAAVPRCDQCEEQFAEIDCSDCARVLCENCFSLLHKSAKKQAHNAIRLQMPAQQPASGYADYSQPAADANAYSQQQVEYQSQYAEAAAAAAAPAPLTACSQCEEQAAVLFCDDCARPFCPDCDALLHKSTKKQSHVKHMLPATQDPAQQAQVMMCTQCEEKAGFVKCLECDRVFCGDCNDLLHKSAKKKEHNRIEL